VGALDDDDEPLLVVVMEDDRSELLAEVGDLSRAAIGEGELVDLVEA
jgi:hypothetical protein